MERKVSLEDKSPETIEMLADVFDDLQTALEPIRDKALDERARLVGYAQCAEQMIKIIADQVVGLRALAKRKADVAAAVPVVGAAVEKPAEKPVADAAPTSFTMGQAPAPPAQPAPKNGAPRNGRSRVRAAAREATKGGDNSA